MSGWSAVRRLLLFPLIAGCGGDDLVFLDRPWAADRTVVLLAVNADGPIGAPSISTGEKLQLSIDADPPFSVFAWVFAAEVLAPGCSVGIGGEGFPLPQGEVWEALVRSDRGPSFARAEAPSIDLKTACALPLPCPDSMIESWPIPQLAGNITAIVPLDGRRALIAGDRGTRILDF